MGDADVILRYLGKQIEVENGVQGDYSQTHEDILASVARESAFEDTIRFIIGFQEYKTRKKEERKKEQSDLPDRFTGLLAYE
jgi:hypothetical protein